MHPFRAFPGSALCVRRRPSAILPSSGSSHSCRRSLSKSGSSSRWLARHRRDAFVGSRGDFRARSAFKLLELDEKHGVLCRHRPRPITLDLGAAPGGWSQVAASRQPAGGLVVMSDLLRVEPIAGAEFVQGDFLEGDVQAQIVALAKAHAGSSAGKVERDQQVVDVVLSDMAPNTTGQAAADHERQVELAFAALEMARTLLRADGTLLVKVFAGPEDQALARDFRNMFHTFKRVKPASSRKESREIYFLGLRKRKEPK